MSYTRKYQLYVPIMMEHPPGTILTDYSLNLAGSRTGTAVPDWRKKVRAAQNASSYFLSDRYRVDIYRPGKVELRLAVRSSLTPLRYDTLLPPEVYTGFNGNVAFAPVHLNPDSTAAEAKCLALLYEKLRHEDSHMNGLQFIGELRESLRMIRRPGAAILKGLRRYDTFLRKARRGLPSKMSWDRKQEIFLLAASGAWLEVSFGWKPLIQDSMDIAETLARNSLPDRHRTRIRKYVETEPSVTVSDGSAKLGGPNDFQYTTYHRLNSSVRGVMYLIGLRYDASGPQEAISRFLKLSGFTPENFVPTIYELIPFSWLVDYFTNLGDIISSTFTATRNLTFATKTTRQFTRMRATTLAFQPEFPDDGWGGGTHRVLFFSNQGIGELEISRSTIERTVLDQLPLPPFTWTLPGSVNRYANIGALLAQTFSNPFRGR